MNEQLAKEQPKPIIIRGLIDYPFPLREVEVARLMLPRDITVSEVNRIYEFMLTLTRQPINAGNEL